MHYVHPGNLTLQAGKWTCKGVFYVELDSGIFHCYVGVTFSTQTEIILIVIWMVVAVVVVVVVVEVTVGLILFICLSGIF